MQQSVTARPAELRVAGQGQGQRAAAAEGRTRTQTGTAHGGGRRQDQDADRNGTQRRPKAGRGQEKIVVGGQDASIREQGQTSYCVRKEREEEKKERSGRWLLLRISITCSASLHIPSSRSVSLHIPSSRIPDSAKGCGLAGTRRDTAPLGGKQVPDLPLALPPSRCWKCFSRRDGL